MVDPKVVSIHKLTPSLASCTYVCRSKFHHHLQLNNKLRWKSADREKHILDLWQERLKKYNHAITKPITHTKHNYSMNEWLRKISLLNNNYLIQTDAHWGLAKQCYRFLFYWLSAVNLLLSGTLMANANDLHFTSLLSYMKCRMSLQNIFHNEHTNCIQFLAANGKVFACRSARAGLLQTNTKVRKEWSATYSENFISQQMLLWARIQGVHSHKFHHYYYYIGFHKNVHSEFQTQNIFSRHSISAVLASFVIGHRQTDGEFFDIFSFPLYGRFVPLFLFVQRPHFAMQHRQNDTKQFIKRRKTALLLFCHEFVVFDISLAV